MKVEEDIENRGKRKKKKPTFYLKTFDVEINSKALPLGYIDTQNNPSSAPNPLRVCDYHKCTIQDPSHKVIRLGCFHTFHEQCYNFNEHQCPNCTPFIIKRSKELGELFNSGLLTSKRTSQSSEVHPDNDDNSNDDVSHRNEKPPEYFNSEEWQNHSDEVSTAQVNPLIHSQSQVQVTVLRFGNIKFWLLPISISQSTLNGRQGSNACSFIALLMSKAFYANQHHLSFGPSNDLSPVWILVIKGCIQSGNNCHDRVTGGRAINFTIQDAAHHLGASMVNAQLEEPFDLTFVCENPQLSQSALSYYLQRLTHEQHLSALVIISDMSISFVAQSNEIVILDNHTHSQHGAMIGKCAAIEIEDFLVKIKEISSPNTNMCTMTFVKFG